MYIPGSTKRLLYAALLGVFAAAIIGSFVRGHWSAFADRSVAATVQDLSGFQTRVRGTYDTYNRRLQSKYEAQIRENDMRMSRFKEQRAKGIKEFRKTYDVRMAELERRNVALKAKLDDLMDVSAETSTEHK
jgi:hypothetical protein